jgi:hypothetical protein
MRTGRVPRCCVHRVVELGEDMFGFDVSVAMMWMSVQDNVDWDACKRIPEPAPGGKLLVSRSAHAELFKQNKTTRSPLKLNFPAFNIFRFR